MPDEPISNVRKLLKLFFVSKSSQAHAKEKDLRYYSSFMNI